MRFVFRVIICLLITGFAHGVRFFDNKGTLQNKDLETLLFLTDVPHSNTLLSIVEGTQARWLRRKERWDVQNLETRWDDAKRFKILILAEKLGYIRAIQPLQRTYATVLFLGATAESVQNRLNYLVHLWHQGIRFKKIVMLGSTRSLDAPKEDAVLRPLIKKEGFATNELGLMMYFYKHVSIPEDLRLVPIQCICSKAPQGKTRADTEDTIKDWLQATETILEPESHLLVISSQYYCAYQDASLRSLLNKILIEKNISMETVGSESSLIEKIGETIAPSAYETAILLDAIARHFYMLQKAIVSSKKCV